MKNHYVLDAWALLALLQGEEPAASRVKEILNAAKNGEIIISMSIINLGEIYYSIGKLKGKDEADEKLELIQNLPLSIISATDNLVLEAATIKMHYPVSYADAFAAALSQRYDAVLLSGDPELEQLRGEIQLEKLDRK